MFNRLATFSSGLQTAESGQEARQSALVGLLSGLGAGSWKKLGECFCQLITRLTIFFWSGDLRKLLILITLFAR
jgi:hypothetical protein